MGMQNTQASYPRVCTHESQTFSTDLLESKRVKTNTCHKLLAKNKVFIRHSNMVKLQFPIWRCCENNLKRIKKWGGWCKLWMLFLVLKSLCQLFDASLFGFQ